MSPRDRRGQIVADVWRVEEDHGRTKRGDVIWRLRNVETGEDKYRTTAKIIRCDRATVGVGKAGCPA